MLKGHVFNLQTFTSEAFALFIDKFLNGRCGVAKGCELSNTSNSATVGEGYFVVRGRFLQIISGETISNITANGYYSLVCEIDLSKTNTADALNQAAIKAISSTSTYPTLTQQDITGTGTVYQYEFARFKVESGSITNFIDKRTFVDFTSIYDVIQNESNELIEEIRKALADVLDGSVYLLKTDIDPNSLINRGEISASTDIRMLSEAGIYICKNPTIENGYPTTLAGVLEVIKSSETSGHVIQRYSVDGSNIIYERHIGEELGSWVKIINSGDYAVLTGSFEVAISSSGTKEFDYPSGYTVDNCVAVSFGIKVIENKGYNYEGIYTDSGDALDNSYRRRLNLNSNKVKMVVYNPNSEQAMTVNYKLVLMKIS